MTVPMTAMSLRRSALAVVLALAGGDQQPASEAPAPTTQAAGLQQIDAITDKTALAQVIGDGHAPGRFRAQTVRNIDAWYEAFAAKPGQKLYLEPKDRVRVW